MRASVRPCCTPYYLAFLTTFCGKPTLKRDHLKLLDDRSWGRFRPFSLARSVFENRRFLPKIRDLEDRSLIENLQFLPKDTILTLIHFFFFRNEDEVSRRKRREARKKKENPERKKKIVQVFPNTFAIFFFFISSKRF